jgi:ABC transporter fused permease/ATP-binding protein
MASSPLRPGPSAGNAPPEPKNRDLRPLMELFALVRPYGWRFWLATVALFISSGLGLVYPQAARKAVDFGLSSRSMSDLNQMTLLLIAVFVIQAVFIWIRHYMMSWLGQRVVSDLRVRVFRRLVQLPPSWFHQRHTGEILSRLSSDVTVVDGLVGTELSMALRHSVTLLGGIGLLLYENWKLTVTMLAIVPPIIVAVVYFGRKVRKVAREIQDDLAKSSAQVEEVVSSIQTVQSFVREAREADTYDRNIAAVFDRSRQLISIRSSFMSGFTLATSLAIAAVVWIGGRAVVLGELSGGDLTAFLLYTAMVAASVGALASLAGALSRAAGATERLFEILRTEPEIMDPPQPLSLPQGPGDVRFENVQFHYASRPDVEVIQGVTLHVAAGTAVALVGSSGAGKTTLTALLQRFHDVTGGRILLDGTDVRQLRLSELRRAMAIVSQEPVLFSGTIRDNIAYAVDNPSQEAIENAARDAHAHGFISDFPKGYETIVGERGVQLSGGQRQRIAIARALLADPRVLILDEATSSLDAESEALVQKALQRLMQGRTTLIIAHRLSTVRNANAIAVLDHGQLAELGKHDELLAQGGIYKRLVEHQVIASTAVLEAQA